MGMIYLGVHWSGAELTHVTGKEEWKYLIIEEGVAALVRRKVGDKVVDWGQVFEEKQSLEEVLERGKGGTAIILSALRAVTDLSGLRGERRASVVLCDPRLHFMACRRSLSVWEKTA